MILIVKVVPWCPVRNDCLIRQANASDRKVAAKENPIPAFTVILRYPRLRCLQSNEEQLKAAHFTV